MYRVVIFVIISAIAVGALNALKIYQEPVYPLDDRIIGGKDADIADYPYQVSLQSSGIHICGGSIISENFIITAAHCTEKALVWQLKVRVNSSFVDSGGHLIEIADIFENPNYDPTLLDYDISILKLAKQLNLGPGVEAINLPKFNEDVPNGTTVVVSGWGVTRDGNQDSFPQLQVVTVNIVDRNTCQHDYVYNNITERMICAGTKDGGKDACQGDSGGPLVADRILVGIVSWGGECALAKYPGVYADVAKLRNFITEVTGI